MSSLRSLSRWRASRFVEAGVVAVWAVCAACVAAGLVHSRARGEDSVGADMAAAESERVADGGEVKPEPASERTDGVAKSSPDAARTLDAARSRLVGYRSVRARLTEIVRIGRTPLRLEGVYVQGPQLRLRLEYTLTTAGTTAELLEVCDGQLLLSRRRVGDQVHVTRRDVRQILDALRGSGNVARTVLAFQMGLGGLPALLASLQQTMDWTRQQDTSHNGQPAVIIEGRWKAAIRERLGGEKLPDYVPEVARVTFDRRLLFPRRFDFFRAPSGDGDAPTRPMLTLSIDDVELDGPVSDADFTFVPPDNVQIEDVTQAYIQALRPRNGETPQDGQQRPTRP